MPTHLSPNYKNRYPGVKPFTPEEKELFFGRQKDVEDLHSLIFIKQTVILYGKSGYGKSSLLNAGIIPKLKEEDKWIYFSIRFNNFSEREASENLSPVDNIKLRIRQDLDKEATSFLDTILPDENSFWYWIKAYQLAKKKSQFIFFFDQFEELFTYPKSQIEDFSEQLSQLLYNIIPVKFRKRLAEMDEENPVSDELHNYLYEKPEIKVVFSVRADRLAQLNGLTDRHPAILQNYYELDALNRKQAEDAIICPAKASQAAGFATPEFTFTNDALQKILDSIANPLDGKIETATLQIVCRYIEDELVSRKGITQITGNLLGDIADIFKQYYESILARLTQQEREKAQHLIEDELIEEGRRNTLTANYIKTKFGLDEKLLLQLEQSSLLRKERDASGRILYEISHDTLVGAIDKVAQGRRAIEEEDKRKKLEDLVTEERNRSEYLSQLNKKVVIRSRLALALAILSLLVAGWTFYLRHELKAVLEKVQTSENTAIEQQANANEQAKIAKTALFKNNMQKAQTLLEDVKNNYLLSNDYSLALRNLNAADSLLLIDIKLPTPEENERDKLLMAIDEQIKICKNKKE